MNKKNNLTLNYLNIYMKLLALNHPKQSCSCSACKTDCERMDRTIINLLKALPTSFKSNLKNHNKLTFVYNNTKHQNANYLSYVFLFGRNGCLPLDLMFDINTNNDIKNKPHSDHAQNQKNVVKEVYSKICQNNFHKKAVDQITTYLVPR